MTTGIHVKYTLFWSDFNKTWTFVTDFQKKKKKKENTYTKFRENPSCVSWIFPYGRTGMTNLFFFLKIWERV
jgi:hypothetical protein